MDNNKLFVGSISFKSTDESLAAFFAAAGTVVSATILKDRMTGRSKGFGFVEMSTPEEAQKAIEMLNNKELDGRPIRIDLARPRAPRENRF
jgi:RNA recognition motif-containing protein